MNLNYYKNRLQANKILYLKNRNLRKYAFLKKAINNIKESNFNHAIINNMLGACALYSVHHKSNVYTLLEYWLKKEGFIYE